MSKQKQVTLDEFSKRFTHFGWERMCYVTQCFKMFNLKQKIIHQIPI
jgi:hypothetical protein